MEVLERCADRQTGPATEKCVKRTSNTRKAQKAETVTDWQCGAVASDLDEGRRRPVQATLCKKHKTDDVFVHDCEGQTLPAAQCPCLWLSGPGNACRQQHETRSEPPAVSSSRRIVF